MSSGRLPPAPPTPSDHYTCISPWELSSECGYRADTLSGTLWVETYQLRFFYKTPKYVLKVNLCLGSLSAVGVDIDRSRHVKTCHIHLKMQICRVAYIHRQCKAHYFMVTVHKIPKILKMML